MLGLIIGGAGSGKSEYAEKLAVRLAEETGGPLVYLATMVSGSGEADARIRKHRKNRAGRGFLTIEKYTGLADLQLGEYTESAEKEDVRKKGCSGEPAGSKATVLLEDLGNLLGNEMFLPEGRGEKAVLSGIRHIAEQCLNLIIVANEVFSDGQKYDKTTREYLRGLALIQRDLAEEACLVTEVICGCPNHLKNPEDII